jgi:hypothetical protein
MNTAVRLLAFVLASLVLAATPARAQFTPRSLDDPATGEVYHVEGSFGIWSPSSNVEIASEGLGIPGSSIDVKRDLGMIDQRFRELRFIGRPARKHKFRFQYIPINYVQQATLVRDVVFQGQRYRVGLPVNSQLKWNAFRFGYEYDFIYRNRGFVGFILDAKYTDVSASLQSPLNNERIRARAPIPTIGGIGRFYIVPNISITGELTGADIPDALGKRFEVDGHYFDLDIYGTVNFNNYVGAQIGYRKFDVSYSVEDDTGAFVLKGLYFGGVARF